MCVAERACCDSVYDVLLNTVIPCLHTVINAKGNGDSQPAENMEGWTEGIESEGDPSDDNTARRWPQW